jgi:hypothetical protein
MKKLAFVFILLLVLVILVIMRLLNKNIFKGDTSLLIDKIANNSIYVATDEFNEVDFLIVNLDNSESITNNELENMIHINFENILNRSNQKIFRKTNLKIALYSVNDATSAKAFTILNQLGFKNVFILKPAGSNNEVLKYKFQPDTTIRLE